MKKKLIIDYCFAVAGCISLAIGVVIFLGQNHIATGGPPGIAILLNHLFGLSIGTVILLVNLPLLLLGYKNFGKKYIFRTLTMIILTAIFTDLASAMFPDYVVSSDQLLNSIFGGVFVGCGLGFMFRSGGSAGGWSILAQILSNITHIPVGKMLFILDGIVIIGSVLVFRNIESALYGSIGIYVSSKIIDIIVVGNVNIKSVHISCKSAKELIPLLNEEFSSPGTIIECKQYGSLEKKDLIFIAIPQAKVYKLKKIINKQDPDSYMIVTDATVLTYQ